MTTSNKPATLKFMGKEFDLKLLEQAIAKSAEVYIESGKPVHEEMISKDAVPASWAEKFKRPVLTIYENRYVLLVAGDELVASLKETKDGIVTGNGFKAKFVTKYNFNQSKVSEVPDVPAPPPVPVAPVYQDRKPPQWKSNNGFQKDHGSGLNRGNRNGKSY